MHFDSAAQCAKVNIQRSADFYVKVFGWRIKRRGDGSTAFDEET